MRPVGLGKARVGQARMGVARRSAAVQLVRAHDPLTGARVWVALSRSHPEWGYLLREGPDGRHVCSCPGFGYRGWCSHLEALYARLRPGSSQGAILTAGAT